MACVESWRGTILASPVYHSQMWSWTCWILFCWFGQTWLMRRTLVVESRLSSCDSWAVGFLNCNSRLGNPFSDIQYKLYHTTTQCTAAKNTTDRFLNPPHTHNSHSIMRDALHRGCNSNTKHTIGVSDQMAFLFSEFPANCHNKHKTTPKKMWNWNELEMYRCKAVTKLKECEQLNITSMIRCSDSWWLQNVENLEVSHSQRTFRTFYGW